MSHSIHFSPTPQALSQDPWQKPWAKSIILAASVGAFYLVGTLFLYKNTVALDSMVNSAFVTCTQGIFSYAGGYGLTILMKLMTILGSKSFLIPATCGVCAWLYVKHRPSLALFFALQMVVGGAFTALFKHLFNRPRPNGACLDSWVSTGSFPSGHAMMSTVFLGTLVFLISRMPSYHASRILLTINAIVLGLAIGISRLYLGVHWFSDVMGGWLFGLLWAIIGLNLLTYWERRFHAHRP